MKTVVKLLGISSATVKNWCAEFAAFLSPGATPATGTPRAFDDKDLHTLSFIAHQRKNGRSYDDIAASLAAGDADRFTSPHEEEIEGEPSQRQLVMLSATVARYEGELAAVLSERDRLLTDLENERQARSQAGELTAVLSERDRLLADLADERQARSQAERAAAAAEAQLQLLKELQQPAAPAAAEPPGLQAEKTKRPSWWQRLWGKE